MELKKEPRKTEDKEKFEFPEINIYEPVMEDIIKTSGYDQIKDWEM